MIKFAESNDLEYSSTFNKKYEHTEIRVHGQKCLMYALIYDDIYTTPQFLLIDKTEENPLGKISLGWSGDICKTYSQMLKSFVYFEYNLYI